MLGQQFEKTFASRWKLPQLSDSVCIKAFIVRRGTNVYIKRRFSITGASLTFTSHEQMSGDITTTTTTMITTITSLQQFDQNNVVIQFVTSKNCVMTATITMNAQYDHSRRLREHCWFEKINIKAQFRRWTVFPKIKTRSGRCVLN